MNKLIVIESGDRLGKGTLIGGLCKYFDYKNIAIRHCDKPFKNIPENEILDYQFKIFTQEFELIRYIQMMNRKFMYHDNIIIYDRFYLGEYVYGQMFRNYSAELIKNNILDLEKNYINELLINNEVYLITLTASPEFFNSRESDGHELSKTLYEKTKELELFKEAHDFSIIPNKLLLKVDKPITELYYTGPGEFRTKQDILDEVINFIK